MQHCWKTKEDEYMGKYPMYGSENIIKIVLLCMLIHRFNIISIRILAGFLAEIDKLILKFTQNFKGSRTV